MHVAGEAVTGFLGRIGHAVDAHIDDDGAGLDHVGRDEFGAADGGDEDVGLAGDRGQVGGLRVADGDGGVGPRLLLEGEQGDGFADDEAAAEDDNVLAVQFHAGAHEQFHDAGGRAGDESGIIFLGDLAEVDGVEAVDVLLRGHAAEDGELVDVLG